MAATPFLYQHDDKEMTIKSYTWLWFDADGTLFDYQRAEGLALARAFQTFGLSFDATVLNTYRQINQQLWNALERREITPPVLQIRRFEQLLEAIHSSGSPAELSAIYLEHLAVCGELMEGAYEVLEALHGTHQIAIITNGLKAVQRSRLSQSGIENFVDAVIISEEIGIAKPHAGFFDAAMAKTDYPARGSVLVIGDSLTSDMRGGAEYGLDTCWFNPGGESLPPNLAITYEIRRLEEICNKSPHF